MQLIATELPHVLLVESRVFSDDRGSFRETYHAQKLADAGLDVRFVQDNHSRSIRGVLRGLHYQIEQPQGKLIDVVRGEIFDVAVDLRRSSPTFGRWVGRTLREGEGRSLYIPPGFAHGFCVLSKTADVCYKCTDLYAPQHERTLLWNDPDVGIAWPFEGPPVVSAKDASGVFLTDAECFA
jgi:dTDP-4-dehydrorhamnose 3,5-epimerase